METIAVQSAQRFADVLDDRQYDSLSEVLAADCEYVFRDNVVSRVAGIIETYRENTEWGFDIFDAIEFESSVTAETPDTVAVTFVDRLYFQDASHEHRCRQVLTIDEAGRITRIVHVDLDGESEALEAFFVACGIERPQ